MSVKIDLPILAGDGEQPLLLDGNAGFANIVPQGSGYTWTEKYAQKKSAYEPITIGTESSIRNNYYLVKEQNFRDIGGGFFEFERVYANVPSTWEDTGQFSYNYITIQTLFVGNGAGGLQIETIERNKSAMVSTKVTHSYQLNYPDTDAAISLFDPVYTEGNPIPAGTIVRPPEVNIYMGTIYEIREYTILKTFNA